MPALVDDAGDVVLRAVGVLAGGVAEHDLDRLGRVVAAGHVLDRDRERWRAVARERGVVVDDVELHLAEDELEATSLASSAPGSRPASQRI